MGRGKRYGSFLPLFLIAVLSGAAAPAAEETPELDPSVRLERPLGPGQADAFRLHLAAGDLVEVAVDQRGVDVVLTLFDPAGRTVLEVDSPISAFGEETLLTVAGTGGTYRLVVGAGEETKAGRYELRVVALGAADETGRTRAAAAAALAAGETARRGHSYDAAAQAYREALRLFRAAEDRRGEAEAHERLGRVHQQLEEWREALKSYEKALPYFRDGHPRREAAIDGYVGRAWRALGEPERALRAYRRALSLQRELGHRYGEGLTLNSLGLLYAQLGEIQRALDDLDEALRCWRELGNRGSEARTLVNLGLLQISLGREERALDHLEEASRLFSQLEDPRAQATALDLMGQAHMRRGAFDEALHCLEGALDLRRRGEDRRGEAVTLANLGRLRQRRGELDEALHLYQEALSTFVELEDRRGEAQVRRNLAEVQSALDRPGEALETARAARELFQEVGDGEGEADAWVRIAVAERSLGEPSSAQRSLEKAFVLYESLRAKALSEDVRASYFATLQERYDFYVDLLMELHEREPAAGYDALAFEASERSRARTLLDELERASGAPRQGVDPALLEEERSIQERLNSTERLRHERRELGEEVQELDGRLRALAEELHEVRGRLAASRPRTDVLGEGTPLSVTEVQRQVLDEGTQLLVVKLGERRSFLWLLSRERLQSFELGPRREIEDAAKDAYRFLVKSHRIEGAAAARRALCELSERVLGPAASELAKDRLAVVTEGALAYVPFAALPDPAAGGCGDAPPLAVTHEIVHLPSASILAALRRAFAGRKPAPGSVAVIADPVFEPTDPRLKVAKPAAVAASGFKRLPFSAREAAAILAAAPDGETFEALGFAANKATVLSGVLSHFRVVHFATHGVLDAEHPDLSSIVLSQLDERGRARDGLLRVHEIHNLELHAELVVLSACRTALGQAVRGEGLVGLSRAFMNAGTPRLLVSLWSIGDEAAAELMARFYRHLLVAGEKPAEALRAAQVETLNEDRRRAPYYWAGFVLQGEWR